MVLVPEEFPMLIADEAPPAKLTVVAVELNRFAVVPVVETSPVSPIEMLPMVRVSVVLL